MLSTVLLWSCSSPAKHVADDHSIGPTRSNTSLRIAVLRGIEPAHPFLDLGPLLVADVRSERELHDRLQLEGDRLRANGFIFEGRGLQDVYKYEGPDNILMAAVMLVVLAIDVAEGDVQKHDANSGVRVYVRAYRAVSGPLPPVPLGGTSAATTISPILVERIDAFSSLQEQLTFVHKLFAGGDVAAKAYEAIRETLCRHG
jgi:hypothetical protein